MKLDLKKQLTPILLVCAAAGAAVYAWVVDRGSVTETERSARADMVFPAFRRMEISRAELEQGAQKLVLVRDPSPDAASAPWRMTSPRAETADVAAVDLLLRELEFARFERKLSQETGMESPRLRGSLQMGSIAYRFALGAPAPAPEGAAYLKVDGEGTYVVSKAVVIALTRGWETYRDRTLLPYSSLAIQKLEVAAPGSSFAVTRANDVDFTIDGSGLRASRSAIEKLWSALADVRAEAFVDDAEADRAIATPALTVSVTPSDSSKPRIELVVGGACPAHPDDVVVVKKTAPRISACAPKAIVTGLAAPPATLIDARLFSSREDEIAEIRLEVPGGKVIDLARTESGWRERAPRDKALDAEEAEGAASLIAALSKSEGADAKKDLAAKLEVRARVRVVKAGNRGEEVIEVGPVAADGGAHVKRLADGASLRVGREVARRLAPRAVAVRGHGIWAEPVKTLTFTALRLSCGGITQDLASENAQWKMRAPQGYRADSAALLDVASAVAAARAESWVADADDGSFGFAASACSVSLTVTTDAGAKVVGLTFGAETDGGVYARADGDPAVFIVSKSVRDAASRILVDRSPFRLDPAELTRLTATRGKDQVVLTRTGDKLGIEGKPERSAAVERALSELYAESVLHLGAPGKDEGIDTPTLVLEFERTGDGGGRSAKISLGLLTTVNHERMYYARIAGTEATFVIPKERVDALLTAL